MFVDLFSQSVFHISNPAITAPDVFHCLHVGDRKEVEIFTGPLSGNRYIAVLLNRDDVKVCSPLRIVIDYIVILLT